MATFEDYQILLSSQPENEREYELLIISHSLMSKTYYLVIDSAPLTALNGIVFEPANITSASPINSNDLDQTASFSISDVDNVLDDEMDLIPLDNEENIVCRSVIVTSSDLDTPMIDISFYVETVPQQLGLFTIKSSVTDLNAKKTGEAFTLTDFPMLRAI